jgi:hypothetical protein
MKRACLLLGVVLMLLGVAAMIHPQFGMPAKESQTVDFAGQEVIVRTQRIVRVPKASAILVIFAGLGFVFLWSLKEPLTRAR